MADGCVSAGGQRKISYGSFTVSDATPPAVSITAPANGAAISGSVNVTANASDNVGVSKVEFYADNALQNTDLNAPYSFVLDSTQFANGSHTLLAKAYDAADNTAQASVSVTVSNTTPDTTPPTVSITAPANGAAISGSVNVTANASDNVGVSKVEFYADNALQNTDLNAPYSFVLDSTQFANGSHTLLAKAYDAADNTAQASVSVTVSNTTPDTTPPTVSITAPANGAAISGSVNVTANASDNVGVSKVEFYADNALQNTDSDAPYSFVLDSTQFANGSHTLLAKAYDAADNAPWSSILVTVQNTADTSVVNAIGEVYVFPNPAKNGVSPVFHIETGPAKVEILIYDLSGKPVHKKILDGEPAAVTRNNKLSYAYEYAWDVTNVTSGACFYIITIDNGSGKTTRKGKFAVIK